MTNELYEFSLHTIRELHITNHELRITSHELRITNREYAHSVAAPLESTKSFGGMWD